LSLKYLSQLLLCLQGLHEDFLYPFPAITPKQASNLSMSRNPTRTQGLSYTTDLDSMHRTLALLHDLFLHPHPAAANRCWSYYARGCCCSSTLGCAVLLRDLPSRRSLSTQLINATSTIASSNSL
jgi:hypothetical protein